MSLGVGALFTIAGANFAGTGIRIDGTVGPPAIFGLACDLWEDFSSDVTVASGLLTSITDRSANHEVLSGSIPYNATAVGAYGGVSNEYGASPAPGYLTSTAGAKSVYDWNQPFSVSLAFIFGAALLEQLKASSSARSSPPAQLGTAGLFRRVVMRLPLVQVRSTF